MCYLTEIQGHSTRIADFCAWHRDCYSKRGSRNRFMMSSMQTHHLSDRRSRPRLSPLALDDLLHQVHALQFSIKAARRKFETEDSALEWPSEPRAPAQTLTGLLEASRRTRAILDHRIRQSAGLRRRVRVRTELLHDTLHESRFQRARAIGVLATWADVRRNSVSPLIT